MVRQYDLLKLLKNARGVFMPKGMPNERHIGELKQTISLLLTMDRTHEGERIHIPGNYNLLARFFPEKRRFTRLLLSSTIFCLWSKRLRF